MRHYLIFALCIGCGAAPAPVLEAEHAPLTAVIAAEETFPALELEQQDWALAEWNRALGGQLFWTLQVGGKADWFIRRTVIDQCTDGPSMGCTRYNERRIDIDSWGIYPVDAFEGRDDMDWTGYRWVMLHEFGHALGVLEHTSEGLMGQYETGQNCIDQTTLDALAAVRQLPEGSKPTCR